MDLSYSSIRTQAATFGVSLLKVEPKVSTFPVIKTAKADFITFATMKILRVRTYMLGRLRC